MRYWLYSEGNILGPYSPAELLSVPAFTQSSLVCPENATGDSPGDWRSADQVAEIADSLSVGVGGVIPSSTATWADSFELETGLSSNISSHYETKTDQPYGYENLLNTIDNILGAYKENETPSAQPKDAEPDSSLMDRFDIRLSKIQEELEAARWEKNLLLERLRSKDREEQKNKERIMQLEEKLRGASEKQELQDKEISQFRHLSDLQETSDSARKLSEIKQESLEDQRKTADSRLEHEERLRGIKPEPLEEAVPGDRQAVAAGTLQGTGTEAGQEARPGAEGKEKPEAAPSREGRQETIRVPESRPLKSMRPTSAVGLERTLDADAGDKDEKNLTSRKLTSLGHSQLQSFKPGDFKEDEAAEKRGPAGAAGEPLQPLPQQASGVVYDFTVVTRAAQESEKFQFKIETKGEPAPGQAPVQQQASPGSQAPQEAQAPGQQAAQPQAHRSAFQQAAPAGGAPGFMQTQPSWMGQQSSSPGPKAAAPAPAAGAKPPESPAGDAKTVHLPDKTERIPVPTLKKGDEPVKQLQPEVKKKRSKAAFLITLVLFGAIAAGCLAFFFWGEGGPSSFFNFSGKKSKEPAAAAQSALNDDKAVLPPAPGPSGETPPAPKPASEPSPNENTRKAMETVKNYKLSGGRGTISSWFANSFLSNSARGLNEEWSATILHGDIYVVQYRLLKPKQDPLIYQFEVDVARGIIVRGINNNAIEVLDFSSKATARADTPAKPRTAPKRPPKTRAQLPLPDAPGRQALPDDPNGFETPAPEENEKVKYIKAQESDEELF